ncbi:MAG: D-alanyl-D-alanine carboxypeptidase family protein [Pseudomonadota bacterium]|nr:D-alanyl-D-alanine carboxypeptidase family protein [Pseudomonadota bacterium]
MFEPDEATQAVRTAPRGAFGRCLAGLRFAFVALLAFSVHAALPARALAQADIPYIVVDRATGEVLVEHRAFERWYPASLTKMMTFYVALRAIEQGELAPGSPVVMSRNAAGQPPSRMGLAVGATLRLDTALQILVVKSANDLAVAIAEAVAGSVPRFAERMNAEAARLGMSDSHFVNPHGLHAPGQYVSARDVALLAHRIFAEFPRQAAMFAAPAVRFGDDVSHSYNLLLERVPGADGLKTGFVCASGYNFAASAARGGRGLVAVVLGAFSQTERAVEAARLLLEGFERPGGVALAQFRRPGAPVAPVSQRPRMCSEKAYSQRYDPGAGAAVIESPFLDPRRTVRDPVSVALGGVDAPASDAYLTARLVPDGDVPVPAPRPDYQVVDIDGMPRTGPSFVPGTIPVPTPRPRL